MRIQSTRLANFKRFSDLALTGIPETAKLVVVVGPNGCGKSSLFDGFLEWYRQTTQRSRISDDAYFAKSSSDQDKQSPNRQITVNIHGDTPKKNGIYVRTAYRNDPDFPRLNLSKPPDPENDILARRLIDDDKAVVANYQRLVYSTASGVYDPDNDEKSVRELREELIGAVRTSMNNVFGDILLHSISDPFGEDSQSGSFFFEKGTSSSYHFKNLSGGEKSAFDLILDLHLKKDSFPEAVYCIDEIEAHLHTSMQSRLVEEIVSIVPETGQLWLTTHSLGVLRAAQKLETKAPGSTCIIDFEGAALDETCELQPVTLDRLAWEKLLSITLDDLAGLVGPSRIIVCEGSTTGRRRRNFDAEIYNRVLGSRNTGTVFVSGGSADQVQRNGADLRGMLGAILPQSQVFTLIDRDDLSPGQVTDFKPHELVLSQRNIENYLLADDVIEALVSNAGEPAQLAEALQIKRDALQKSAENGKPANDLKAAAGTIYVGLKQLLDLRQAGSNSDWFMRDTMAPLIVPGMATYDDLEADILDKL